MPGPEIKHGVTSLMSVNIVTDRGAQPCLYLTQCCPGPNQLQSAAQLLQCSQYTCNRSDQNLGAGERDGHRPPPNSQMT